MSPRTLNVEKLEKKFASLTKSRESILGLSTWIIRHKEFYKEIVDQWLDALSKDMNALTMFYVANDVIQNCGRKKAPEFREAFATVLERAVSLEKVKEIKTEVIRMITLWHERSIYDAAFYKKLQDILNDVEESESEEELDEADVITNFKLESLTESLQKLKTLEEELLEKEEFLEDIEEPGIANIDNLIVKMDSQRELRKVDKFQKLVESYLSLADKVMTAQKEAMLNLKYSSIFYSAQLEDAKKVAHAYRIYGKKVKMVEKALTEKLVDLPEASPVFSPEERSPSIDLTSSVEYHSPGFSVTPDAMNENSTQSSNLDLSTSPRMKENDSFMNVNIFNEKYKSPLAESQNSICTLAKSSNTENKDVKSPTVVNVSIVKEDKSPIAFESAIISLDERLSNSPLKNTSSKKKDKTLKSPVILDTANSQTAVDVIKNLNNEKISRSPVVSEKVRTNTDQKSKSPVVVDTAKISGTDKISKSPIAVGTIRRSSTDKIPKSPIAIDTVRKSNTDKIPKSPVTVDTIRKTNTDKISKSPVTVDTARRASTEKLLKSPVVTDTIRKTSTDKLSKSPVTIDTLKRTSTDKISKSPIAVDTVKKSSTDKISKSSVTIDKVRRTSIDQITKSPVAVETVRNTSKDKVPKSAKSAASENADNKNKITSDSISDALNSNLEEEKLSLSSGTGTPAKSTISLETEEISSTSKEPKKTSEPDMQMLSDLENIDFLLEQSYNEQRTKSKASFKRKIDNLLKMKQSKACKLSNNDSLQQNKMASETAVTEDSPTISPSNSDELKKSDAPESLTTKEENPVNSVNLQDNETNISNSTSDEQMDDTKINQSLEMAQNSKTSDFGINSENIALPPAVAFPNFPDIPTELLKNILDKTNMNQPSNVESVTSGIPGLETENVKPTDSNQNSVNYDITANNNKDTLPGLDYSDSKIEDTKSDSQEKSLQDNEKSTIINEEEVKTDTENVTENNNAVKVTPLMENLQKLLKCFTEKGPAFEELKNSKTLKTLPTYSLRSTLKLYHVLKEHHKNDNALSSANVNKDSLPETATSEDTKSSTCNYNTSTNAFAHSENDNLEIMDMEVDSDDDSTK